MTYKEMIELVTDYGVEVYRYHECSLDDPGAGFNIEFGIAYHGTIVGSNIVEKSFVEYNIKSIRQHEERKLKDTF